MSYPGGKNADGVFDVILADPPWHYNNRKAGGERKDRTKFGGGASKHYPLMRDEEIISLNLAVHTWAAPNCALFLWATCPRIDSAIAVLNGWGFRYATVAFVWVKRAKDNGLIFNPGYYTASNVELVLLGVRGSMRPARPMIQQVVEAPRRGHSQKPPEIQRRIEEMYWTPAAWNCSLESKERDGTQGDSTLAGRGSRPCRKPPVSFRNTPAPDFPSQYNQEIDLRVRFLPGSASLALFSPYRPGGRKGASLRGAGNAKALSDPLLKMGGMLRSGRYPIAAGVDAGM